MSSSPPHPDLEISEDPAFTRNGWFVERVGWLLMALLLVAACAGAFGNGPLSHTVIGSGDGLQLEYERFGRRVSPLELVVRLPAGLPDDTVRLWIDRRYLTHSQVEKINPAPLETLLGSDRLIFVFPLKTEDSAEVVFHLEPQEFGFFSGRLGINEGAPLAFDQFIYP